MLSGDGVDGQGSQARSVNSERVLPLIAMLRVLPLAELGFDNFVSQFAEKRIFTTAAFGAERAALGRRLL